MTKHLRVSGNIKNNNKNNNKADTNIKGDRERERRKIRGKIHSERKVMIFTKKYITNRWMYDVNEIISWHYKANELRLHEFMCVKIFFVSIILHSSKSRKTAP